jgi:hypothetical protein
MHLNGDQSSGHLKTRQSEAPAVPSSDETQVKEEDFESLFSTSPVHFDNLGDDESGDHPSSLQPSSISRLPSHLDREDATEVQKLLKRNAELERRLKEEKTAREELVSENDRLHKAQIQLQQQNSKLRAMLRDLQKQYEEKCCQLRECEMLHPQHSQQERVKQERVDDNAAELQQPLQLQARQRRENDAGAKVNADVDVLLDDRVKLEALGGDDERKVEDEEEGDDSDSSDGEDEDGSDSEEEDSDDRPSKRYVSMFNCHVVSNVCLRECLHPLLLDPSHTGAESAPTLLPCCKSITTTGVVMSPPTTRTGSLTRPLPDSVQLRTLLSERMRRRSCFIIEGIMRSIARMLRQRRVNEIIRMKEIANRRSMLGT